MLIIIQFDFKKDCLLNLFRKRDKSCAHYLPHQIKHFSQQNILTIETINSLFKADICQKKLWFEYFNLFLRLRKFWIFERGIETQKHIL
jgi:hypothetical protein